ncbi:MarR family winged helix-turn-helix transcriptional regulator [Methanobrevibacter sp.]|uniref:MarR family winged helix-turn-helix transcriptional regulator n=1 Tax=Methanobrevibacter sp. TaxID=66852 RepID=UPI0025F4F716|nr:MarR family winged helix-turn-helix transcriptional regulator [Methanobrevibacter sp.]MBQ2666814.1 winged helix-turn-helix transcriptional regulator [Methanobrevibacter sp.]
MPFDEDIPTPPLVSLLHRKQTTFINNKLKDVDLSSGLYPLLIKTYKNEAISQEELAEELHINESTVTRNLEKLENKGLITKTPKKRKKIIKTTKKGAEIAQTIMDYDNEWDEKIKKSLSEDEYDDFRDYLIKICEELI